MKAKTLLLMRHAKSGYPEDVGDFDRPLSPRGRRSAVQIGEYLAEHKLRPDRVLCSAAKRAQQTFDYLCDGLESIPTAVLEPKLYLASARTTLDYLHTAPNDAAILLVVGHNPGLQTLALELAGRGSGDNHRRLAAKFPTAGVAMFECDIGEWDELAPARCTLLRFITPRQLLAGA